MIHNRGGDLRAFDLRRAHSGFFVTGRRQHFQLYRRPDLVLERRNPHRGAFFYAKLLSACSDDCNCHNLSTPVSELNSLPKSRAL